MSINPPVYTESPFLYKKINKPEFIKKRLLIITYFNMGYKVDYIAHQLFISEKYCNDIIKIFQTHGLKALFKRDFGLRQKKVQKKFNEYEINLLKCLVKHTPPISQSNWTYNNISNIINHSGFFENRISLCSLRNIMLSKEINLNEWKQNLLDKNDENYNIISNLVSLHEIIEAKDIKDYELDEDLIEGTIKDLLNSKKSVTILNIFSIYKNKYNLPKLSIYKFSKLLKSNFSKWAFYKDLNCRNQTINERKIILTKVEKDKLLSICQDTAVRKIVRIRANICLELNKETNVASIENKLGCSKSMIYRVFHAFREIGIECVWFKQRKSKKTNYKPYITSSIKKYPNMVTDIKNIVKVKPKNKTKWTIDEITNELRKQNYIISTTSVSKLLRYHKIAY